QTLLLRHQSVQVATFGVHAKQGLPQSLVGRINLGHLSVDDDCRLELAGVRVQLRESRGCILKETSEVLTQGHAAVVAFIQPGIAAHVRSGQQVADIQSPRLLKALDGVVSRIDADAAYEREELLSIRVHDARIKFQAASVQVDSVHFRRTRHLAKLASQSKTQLAQSV